MMEMEVMNKKAHELRELKRAIEDLQTRFDNLKQEFQTEMTERGEYELVGDDWKITWNEVSSTRFDQSGFKAMHPELFESFKTSSSSRRFVLQ